MSRAGTRTNVMLFALLSAICTVIAMQWLNPPALTPKPIDAPALSATPTTADDTNSGDYFKITTEEAYSEIIERPLFLATRRPPPPEPEGVTTIEYPPEEPEVNVTLIGVMVTPQATTVLLKDDDEGKVVPLKLGESIKNWELETVEPERVVLRKDEDSKELLLVRNKRKAKSVQQKDRLAKRKEKLKERRLAAQQRRAKRRNRDRDRAAGDDEDEADNNDADIEPDDEAEAENDSSG